jgi:uncharacterized protein (UPF0276 family)
VVSLPLGGGVGLKPQHFAQALAAQPGPAFIEVHAENYMGEGGPLLHWLDRLRERYPLSLHGVGLSLGGEEPLAEDHLDRLAALVRRYRPAAFSEHLAWLTHGGVFFNDLLPLAYDDATLRRVCAHVAQTQERLGCRMLLENPSTYFEFSTSTLDEPQFLAEIVARTGCGLLLDVNNAWVSCVNRGADPFSYIDAFPAHGVGHMHLAGHATDADAAGAPLLIDDHGSPVHERVWALFRHAVARCGPQPTLIEWDNEVPEFSVLLAQAQRADAEMRKACVATADLAGATP